MAAFIIEKLCLGCQRCLDACPYEAIKIVAHLAIVAPDKCRECEACVEICMQGAITFQTNNESKDKGGSHAE